MGNIDICLWQSLDRDLRVVWQTQMVQKAASLKCSASQLWNHQKYVSRQSCKCQKSCQRNVGVTDCSNLTVLQNLRAVSASWSRSQIVVTDEIHSNHLHRSWSLISQQVSLKEFLTPRERMSRILKAEQDEPGFILGDALYPSCSAEVHRPTH